MQAAALVERFHAARKDHTLAVLEGFHAVKHALRFAAEMVVCVTNQPARLGELVGALAPDLAEKFQECTVEVDDAVFERLAPRAPRTGALAIARRTAGAVHLDALQREPFLAPVVLLENPRNLNNVGACVRVAAGAGAAAVLTTGSNDPWHPDALRGAAGLHFAVPVARVTELPTSQRKLIALDPEGEPFNPVALTPNTVLAFGTEREGLTAELLERADARISIPMEPGVSSLNLAVSVSAVLFSYRLARARTTS